MKTVHAIIYLSALWSLHAVGQNYEEEVSIASDVGRDVGACNLGGTLLVPQNAAAVVVMIHGSGSNNRDQSKASGHAPFRDVAERLAEQEVATLRYDKRDSIPECIVRAAASKLFSPFDNIADAKNVAAFTRRHPMTSGLPLFLLGHSQGVNFAIELANEVGASGVVLMAGLSVNPIDKTVLRQLKDLSESNEESRRLYSDGKSFFAHLRAKETTLDDKFMGSYATFWSDWISITERAEAQIMALKVPGFVVQGTDDWNVTREDFDRIAELFPIEESASYLVDGLDHGFTREGETRVPDEVADHIARWIKKTSSIQP